MAAANFEMVTDLQTVLRRDFTLNDKTIANPLATNPLLDGEFVSLTTGYKLIRAADQTLGWAVFVERGRFDVQALGKVTVLFANTYEADTRIFTSGGITSAGQALEISDAVVGPDGQTKSGLKIYASGVTIGYVTRIPSENGNRLRFIQTCV